MQQQVLTHVVAAAVTVAIAIAVAVAFGVAVAVAGTAPVAVAFFHTCEHKLLLILLLIRN